MSKDIKLHVDDLTVSFKTTQGMVRAVRGISFDLYEGETLAIVGESGSGKSVSSRTIMGILAGNGVIDKGSIIYEGEDLTQVDEEHFHELRGNKIGMIFQDPMSSLNPIMKIGKQITEGMILNGKRLKNRYKKLFNEARTDLIRLQQKLEKLLVEQKEAIKAENANKANVKNEFAPKIADLKQQIEVAKAHLNEEKAKAKAITDQEWADAKAECDKDLAPHYVALKDPNLKDENAKYVLAKKEEIAKVKEQLQNKELTREERYAIKDQIRDLKLQIKHDSPIGRIKTKIEERKETLARYKKVTKLEAYEKAIQIMDEVGIPQPSKRIKQYPFQFSGGMRQRIVIAIALTANPDILICDEPTTALDVTIQAQILELINKLKVERKLSVIFITHDLGVVANMADRIAVMYAGKIVEVGTSEDVFYDPKHPYTWALLSSMPDLDSKERLVAIPGTPPNMLYPPKGDAFAERNSYAMKIDFEVEPPMFKISDTHYAATWLLHPDAPAVEMPNVIKQRIDRMLKASEGVSK